MPASTPPSDVVPVTTPLLLVGTSKPGLGVDFPLISSSMLYETMRKSCVCAVATAAKTPRLRRKLNEPVPADYEKPALITQSRKRKSALAEKKLRQTLGD